MEALLLATMEVVTLLSPERIESVAERFQGTASLNEVGNLHHLVTTPVARQAVDRLLGVWGESRVSGDVLAGILRAAEFAHRQTKRESSVELVWTGPTTPFVATRRTEQVLLDLIRNAKKDVFIVSFVAYDVSTVVEAMNAATGRGIKVSVLLETSKSHGGSLPGDPIGTMRNRVPAAELYVWTDRPEPFTDGRVHAKVAVADGLSAFLTSANLTGHAFEKNMEAGVLIKGGHIPSNLEAHLQALIETKVIRRVA
jgi:cardiolipin synthase A/B